MTKINNNALASTPAKTTSPPQSKSSSKNASPASSPRSASSTGLKSRAPSSEYQGVPPRSVSSGSAGKASPTVSRAPSPNTVFGSQTRQGTHAQVQLGTPLRAPAPQTPREAPTPNIPLEYLPTLDEQSEAQKQTTRDYQARVAQRLPNAGAKLQYALDNHRERPNSPHLQEAGHEALLEFSRSPGTFRDVAGVLHQMATSVAPSGAGYGMRNIVKQSIERAFGASSGPEQGMLSMGVNSFANPAAVAVGQQFSNTLLIPYGANKLRFQQADVPTNVIFPDRMKSDLNELGPAIPESQPGRGDNRPAAGDKLSSEINANKTRISDPQTYQGTSQAAFAATSAVNTVAQSSTSDPGLQAFFGVAAPATAAMYTGGTIGTSKATSKVSVPSRGAIEQAQREFRNTGQLPTDAEMADLIRGENASKVNMVYPRYMSKSDIQNKNINAANKRPATWAGSLESGLQRTLHTIPAIAPANFLAPVAAMAGQAVNNVIGGNRWENGQAEITGFGAGAGIALSMPLLQQTTANNAARDAAIRRREGVPAVNSVPHVREEITAGPNEPDLELGLPINNGREYEL